MELNGERGGARTDMPRPLGGPQTWARKAVGMAERGIDHVALQVESLRQAENLYTTLFDMCVVGREARLPSGILPDTNRAPVSPPATSQHNRSVLEGNGLRLVLHCVIADYGGRGRLSHVCIRVPADQVDGLLDRARTLGCVVRTDSCGHPAVEDPYEVCWQIEPSK